MLACRAAVIAVVTTIVALEVARAACVSSVPLLRAASLAPSLTPGPVVWNGSNLVAVSHEEPSDSIWVTLYTQEGYEVAAPRQIAFSSLSGPLAAAWNGSEIGVFYKTRTTLSLQRLTGDGIPVVGPIAIPTKRSLYDGDLVDAAWTEALGGWLLVRRVGGGSADLYATVISATGTVLRDELLDIGPRLGHRVAVNEAGIAGVFEYVLDGRLFMARMSADAPTRLLPVAPAGEEFVVAARGDELVIVQAREVSGTSSIHLRRIDDEGNLVATEKKLLEHDGDIVPLSLVAREDEIALAYLDSPEGFAADPGVYRLRRFRPDGSVIADTLFAAAGTIRRASWSKWPHLWTGSAYLNLVARYFDGRPATYLVRLCPLVVSIEAPAIVRVGTPVQFTAPADGGIPEYDYAWDFGDRNFSGQEAPVHVYDDAGTFTVNVEVVDAAGTVVSVSMPVRVVEGKRRAARH